MRLLTTILVGSLLLTATVSPSYKASLQQVSLASLPAPAIQHVIVKGNGQPRHRGSGRLESYQWLERSLA